MVGKRLGERTGAVLDRGMYMNPLRKGCTYVGRRRVQENRFLRLRAALDYDSLARRD